MKEKIFAMQFKAAGEVHLYEQITNIRNQPQLIRVAIMDSVDAARDYARFLCPAGHKLRLTSTATAEQEQEEPAPSIPALEIFQRSSDAAGSGMERFEALAELVATVGQPAEDAIRRLLPDIADQVLQACSLYKLHTRPAFYATVREELAKQIYSELTA